MHPSTSPVALVPQTLVSARDTPPLLWRLCACTGISGDQLMTDGGGWPDAPCTGPMHASVTRRRRRAAAAGKTGAVVVSAWASRRLPHAQPAWCSVPGPNSGQPWAQKARSSGASPLPLPPVRRCGAQERAERDARLNRCPAAVHDRPGTGARLPLRSICHPEAVGVAGGRDACATKAAVRLPLAPVGPVRNSRMAPGLPSAPPSFCAHKLRMKPTHAH